MTAEEKRSLATDLATWAEEQHFECKELTESSLDNLQLYPIMKDVLVARAQEEDEDNGVDVESGDKIIKSRRTTIWDDLPPYPLSDHQALDL